MRTLPAGIAMSEVLNQYCRLFGYPSCYYVSGIEALYLGAGAVFALAVVARIIFVMLNWLTRAR